ncbi:DUF262 domain-containing protein [Shewanella baltica]|uniref:DUF262 domain-containing protein n=1 Tax=Shewanella baltica TaxID=62322 RepID=UPI0024BAF567|nr:DUF262 domain-containing HNH endonuclease family protein [Shewanella baltica]
MTTLPISNQVDTELLTLEQVHKRNLAFLIPSYQRPYVWTDEDAVKLFEDIKAAFESKEAKYFIGSALSARRDTATHPVYELIDGQQRTTTLMLMSIAFKAANIRCALAEVSILGKQSRLGFDIRGSVSNLLGSFAGLDDLPRPGDEEIKQDEYLRPLAANLNVLKQQVEKLKTKNGFELQNFADFLYKNVVWVNNIVPAAMDLNRLFSSMNTAGLQLEPVDLLKARLLEKINTDKVLYSTIWQACEHLDNYFERNLRQTFKNVNWNVLEYKDLSKLNAAFMQLENAPNKELGAGKSVASLLAEVIAGDVPENAKQPVQSDGTDNIDAETVYCRSIISFELLLIHALRIFCAQNGWPDLEPRIKAGNLLACFDVLVKQDESQIKGFIELLWQVRYQFDTWVVKWVEHDDREDPQLRLSTISRSLSSGKYYINRTAKELSCLVQLQAVRNFTGDRSAHFWLTALLSRLVQQPDMNEEQVLAALEQLDNQLSLTDETQKEATFKIAQGQQPVVTGWSDKQAYFSQPLGTRFEHYWFQKLEYLLWKQADKTDEKLKAYRITSKNSVEHVHPQNEEYHHELEKSSLNAFGNLVLLSPGENSSYSNQTVAKKKADFDSKPRYDALKLKDIFETYTQSNSQWSAIEIDKHQQNMLKLLEMHYMEGVVNGQ